MYHWKMLKSKEILGEEGKVFRTGINLGQFSCLAMCNRLESRLYYAEESEGKEKKIPQEFWALLPEDLF